MPVEETDSLISFAVESGTILVRDELEGQDLRLRTASDEPTIQPALTDLFLFPVDDAISVTVSELTVETHSVAAVLDDDGEQLGEFSTTPREFPAGTYFVKVDGQVLCYLRIPDAAFTGVYAHRESQDSPLTLTFPEPTQVAVGARSFHRRPQATITVPDDPAALREALAYLASSIKEFSCERSWPTLRGHPPAIDRGDALEIPDALSKPETGVTIAVPEPATYADLYRVAPLAFYLGADLEEGAADRPELHLENGYVEPLETPTHSLEERVDELLARCLVLDSLTRAEGYVTGPRAEYDAIASRLPFYPPNLYDASISEQLMEYLEVPFDVLEPYAPTWPLPAVFRTRPDDVELLPDVLDALSPIRVRESSRSTASNPPWPSVSLPRRDGESTPDETGWLVPDAFEHARSARVRNAADARVAYVTDDATRAERLSTFVEECRPDAKLRPSALSLVESPTTDELERVLEAEYDFLYCELPVSSEGASVIECSDGPLRLDALDGTGAGEGKSATDENSGLANANVNAKTVALAGRSDIGACVEFVRRGAFAAVALEDVVEPRYVRRLAEYLLRSHPLVSSVRFAGIDDATASRFVGNPVQPTIRADGGTAAAQLDIETIGPDEHDLSIYHEVTDVRRLGSVSRLIIDPASEAYQLNGVAVRQPQPIPTTDVVSLLEDTDHVARLNGEVYHGETDVGAFVRESVRRAIPETR